MRSVIRRSGKRTAFLTLFRRCVRRERAYSELIYWYTRCYFTAATHCVRAHHWARQYSWLTFDSEPPLVAAGGCWCCSVASPRHSTLALSVWPCGGERRPHPAVIIIGISKAGVNLVAALTRAKWEFNFKPAYWMSSSRNSRSTLAFTADWSRVSAVQVLRS